MKHLYTAFIGLLLLGQPLFCKSQRWTLGVSGGPGLVSLKGSAAFSSQHKTTVGFSAGVSAEYFLSNTFSVVAQPAYERKGAVSKFRINSNHTIPVGTLKIRTHYDYLTLPVLVRATVGHPVSFFVNAGPYFSYLLKQENKVSTDVGLLKLNEKATKTDFGIAAGLGLLVPVGKKVALTFEMRKNTGLADINDSEETEGSVKTNAVNFLLGLVYVPNGFWEEE